jgi:L-alanine-DL-glutamate epimerase-like enolase superfamily enzyme
MTMNRRDLLRSAGRLAALPFVPGVAGAVFADDRTKAPTGRTPAASEAATGQMRAAAPLKIRSVEPILIRTPADAKPFSDLTSMTDRGALTGGTGVWNRIDHASPSRTPGYEQALLVRITTEDGLSGWGEAHAPSAPRMHQRIITDLFGPTLRGEDARNVEALWEKLFSLERVRGYFTGAHAEALAAVDLALWDLLGRAVGQPVWQLLGGRFRDRIPQYLGIGGGSAEQVAVRAKDAMDRGFRMVKMGFRKGPGTADLALVAAAADAVRGRGQVAVDSLGAFKLHEAVKIGREFDRMGGAIAWFEDPLLAEDVSGYRILAESIDTPVTAGEALSNRFQFRDLFLAKAVDIVNPDVCRAAGITECRRIAALADAYGVLWSPHVSTGTALYVAASAHLAAATSNALIMEGGHKLPGPLGNALLQQPLVMDNGQFVVPDGPGFGVDFDEAALRRVTVEG